MAILPSLRRPTFRHALHAWSARRSRSTNASAVPGAGRACFHALFATYWLALFFCVYVAGGAIGGLMSDMNGCNDAATPNGC